MLLTGLHPQLRPYAQQAIDFAESMGARVTITSTYRSTQEQRALYDKWRACVAKGQPGPPCAYPANPPGRSAHQFGLAWDSVIDPPPGGTRADWQTWWDYVRRFFGWEVLPNDRIHAQLRNWEAYVGAEN